VGSRPASVPQSHNELEDVFELALDLIVIVGFDGCLKRVNPAFERTLGYPAGELLSRPFLEVIHPEDLPWLREMFEEFVRGDREDMIDVEHRVVCRDGSVRWLQSNSRVLPERGVVFAVARDVTDRRRADADLRDAHRMVEASRAELARLAEEQAALRRVATLVARAVPPDEAFGAVAADDIHERGIRSAVATPIIVEGRLWGVIGVGSSHEPPLPLDTEARLGSFTELAATAISSTEARTELAASRARIVAATDEERRRLVRDLHDGAQQRLVHTTLTLKLA
jgi:PAS domain S-box-containing protein